MNRTKNSKVTRKDWLCRTDSYRYSFRATAEGSRPSMPFYNSLGGGFGPRINYLGPAIGGATAVGLGYLYFSNQKNQAEKSIKP